MNICPVCREVLDDDGFCQVCLRQFPLVEEVLTEDDIFCLEEEMNDRLREYYESHKENNW